MKATALLAAALSGCASLVYEIVWVRRLGDTLGHGAWSVAIVLATFFLGMGVGARLGGGLAAKSRFPVELYCGLELLLAASAMAFLPAVGLAESVFDSIVPAEASFSLQLIAKAVLATLLLAGPCLAMGATLPVLLRIVTATDTSVGSRVGWLYGVNTIGAAAGCLGAVFVGLPLLGLRGSMWLAATLNVAAALSLFGFRRRVAPVQEPADDAAATAPQPELWIAAFACGFIGVGFEIAWTRALSARTSNTVYSFAVLLAAFLLAIGCGSAAIGWIDRRWPLTRRACGALVVLAGLTGLASMRILDSVASAMPGGPETFAATQLRDASRAIRVMLLPCLALGAAFPAVVRLLHRKGSSARLLGRVYLVNTAGSVAASLAVGFVLLPLLGMTGCMVALASLGVAAGLAILMRAGRWPLAASIALAAVPAFVWLPIDLRQFRTHPSERLVRYTEGVAASVAVIETGGGSRILKVNNTYRLGTDAARYRQQRQGVLPVLLHGGAGDTLVLGLGTGSTAGAVAAMQVRSLDAVEILPEVPPLLPLFERVNEDLAGRARRENGIRILTLDARHFVRSTKRRYDVVIGDLFVPWRAGEGAMFTREHFTAVRTALREDGVFCQWLPAFQMQQEDLRSIVATFATVFEHASLWWLDFDPQVPTVGLVGSRTPLRAERFDPGLCKSQLCRRLDVSEIGDLAACWIADHNTLVDWSAGAETDSRDAPRLEFAAARHRGIAGPARVRATLAALLDLGGEIGESSWLAESDTPTKTQARRNHDALRRVHLAKVDALARGTPVAVPLLAEAMRAAPRSHWLARELEAASRSALERGDDAAATHGATALTRAPLHAHLGHYLRALSLAQSGDKTQARNAVRAALRSQPTHAPSKELLRALDG